VFKVFATSRADPPFGYSRPLIREGLEDILNIIGKDIERCACIRVVREKCLSVVFVGNITGWHGTVL